MIGVIRGSEIQVKLAHALHFTVAAPFEERQGRRAVLSSAHLSGHCSGCAKISFRKLEERVTNPTTPMPWRDEHAQSESIFLNAPASRVPDDLFTDHRDPARGRHVRCSQRLVRSLQRRWIDRLVRAHVAHEGGNTSVRVVRRSYDPVGVHVR
nr:hypothetical protein [Deinococcus yavapaiensis]